ncbi:MAG: pyridoxamine 5'-phosphate oxidase family protein [Pseudomonadota bacterium]
MSADAFYTSGQRAMQQELGTEKLADAVYASIVSDTIDDAAKGFIESRDFFFLATVDRNGMPTVSYKGGAVGVAHVESPTTLIFPSYDGNGMFKSMGNAAETGQAGLLFIDMETPHRVRVQGRCTVSKDDPALARYPAANLLVRMQVESCFINCARYIHKHQRVSQSPYVPNEAGQQPHPSWKRIDAVQDALPEVDRKRTEEEGGPITPDDYIEKLQKGVS